MQWRLKHLNGSRVSVTDSVGLRTNIEVGRELFEAIPNDVIPGWAGLVLSRFDKYVLNVPSQIKALYEIIDDQNRWKEAHEQFTEIRKFLLANEKFSPAHYLHLAELVAKVTYNATGLPAPFDSDSGWYIASFASQAAQQLEEDYIEEEIKVALLMFSRNKEFKINLDEAKDFIIYKKVDDILWFDWDPLGVNDIAPRDEYNWYVPQIFSLQKSGADREQIASLLFKFESERMGMGSTIENCLRIADKIIAL
jgi:hypothetical protein